MTFAHAAEEPGYVPPSYWSGFEATKGKWDQPSFFPICVWMESVLSSTDTAKDKAAGLNCYAGLTLSSSFAVVRSAGMYAIPQYEWLDPGPQGGAEAGRKLGGIGAETVGFMYTDEPDLAFGAGFDGWNGKESRAGCIPPTGSCGFTALSKQRQAFKAVSPTRPMFVNFTSGLIWETPQEATEWFKLTDFISQDIYYYTFPEGGICGQFTTSNLFGREMPAETGDKCHRASNYGRLLDFLRIDDAQDGKYQPLFGVVEVGHPQTEPEPTITGPQIQGAVMSAVIHGARGIVYFNHNFGGSCLSQHLLRDPCGATARAYVTAINGLLKDLAPILNAPKLVWNFQAPNLDTRLSQVGGVTYVFAQQNKGQSGSYSLSLPPISPSYAVETCNGSPAPRVKNLTVAGKIPVTFTKESDWCVWKLAGAAVPPTPTPTPTPTPIPPADPLVQVHQSWLKALQDLVNNPR